MTSPQDDQHIHNKYELSRTIHASDCGISTFDFDLNEKQITELLLSGASAATVFIQRVDNQAFQGKGVEISEEEAAAIKIFAGSYAVWESSRVAAITQQITECVSQIPLDNEQQVEYIRNVQNDVARLQGNLDNTRKEVTEDSK